MSITREHARREVGSALKFAAVGCLGFVTDACLLKLGILFGLEPAWARALSLTAAMQVTFLVNGLLIFRCLRPGRLPHQWAGYMACNGLGNLCNYFIFVAFVSSRWPVISDHLVALAAGSFTAWMINYATVRFLVFGKSMAHGGLSAAEASICGDESEDAAPSAPRADGLTRWSGRRPA
jgi:putative flippase GtrA